MILTQLYAMRLLIDGMIAAIERDEPPPRLPEDEGACPHPAERQVDATTLGGEPQIMCLVCGQQRAGALGAP